MSILLLAYQLESLWLHKSCRQKFKKTSFGGNFQILKNLEHSMRNKNFNVETPCFVPHTVPCRHITPRVVKIARPIAENQSSIFSALRIMVIVITDVATVKEVAHHALKLKGMNNSVQFMCVRSVRKRKNVL